MQVCGSIRLGCHADYNAEAGIAPEVKVSNLLHTQEMRCASKGNPRQMSPEVKNMDISGPTKRTDILQFFKNHNYVMSLSVTPTWNDVSLLKDLFLDVIIPLQCLSASALSHMLMAPPDAPQVSGLVTQTSVWIPRSTHCCCVASVLRDLFFWNYKMISDV